jgi:hypothetical protein
MSVSRSAFYVWLERPLTAIEKDNAETEVFPQNMLLGQYIRAS